MPGTARPLPHIPRGPRRSRAARPTARLLACPRVSPEWELAALQALIKPQLKGPILHRNGCQKWSRWSAGKLRRTAAILNEHFGCEIPIHLPGRGDYHFIAEVTDADSHISRAWAVGVSAVLPELWLVVGRIFVKNGKFYRRRYGYKLSLVPATDIHLPRELRSVLRAALKHCLATAGVPHETPSDRSGNRAHAVPPAGRRSHLDDPGPHRPPAHD